MALPGNQLKKTPESESSGTELSDFDDSEEGTWNESQIMADYDAEVQKLSIKKVNEWLAKRCADDILEVEDVVNFDENAIPIRIDGSPDGIADTLTTVESQSASPQNVGQHKRSPAEINAKSSAFGAKTLVNGWGKPEVEVRNHFEEQKHPTKGNGKEQISEEAVISCCKLRNAAKRNEKESVDVKAGENVETDKIPINNHFSSVDKSAVDRHSVAFEAAKNVKANQNIGTNKKLDLYISDVSDKEINCDLQRKNEMSEESALEILKKSIAAFWAAVPENNK